MNEEFEIQQMNEEEARAAQQDEYIGDEPTDCPEEEFEEQFPSLMGLPAISHESVEGVYKRIKKDMQKYCLDKQKVRDAIISAFEKGSLISRAEIREILTKELGL